MRLPSAQLLLNQTGSVIRRFPLEILISLAGTCIALMLTQDHLPDSKQWLLIRLLLMCLLALPSFIAVNISTGYRNAGFTTKLLMYTVVLVAIAMLFFSFSKEHDRPKDIIRYSMLNVAAHLLVACAGFIGRGSTHAFWQYNRVLFLRIITSAIFSGVLFLGLIGAMAALNELFNLHLSESWYPRIFIIIAGVFNTVFFLYGIPANPQELEAGETYPKVLSIFTRFVLLPLVFIYFAILLAYEVKIITAWQLPNGWVSNLIIAFAIAGILSILLVYPIRLLQEHKWVKVFARWFYILMLPLIVLMFVAIGKRISDYGFTEERLIVLVTTAWLALVSLYFLWKPQGDIRIIPFSLALLAICLQFVIFSISENSQRGRLKKLLGKYGLLKNGVAQKLQANQSIDKKDAESIQSVVRYLAELHGKESLDPILPTKQLSAGKSNEYLLSTKYLDSLGYVKNTPSDAYGHTDFLSAEKSFINIEGYRTLIPISSQYQSTLGGWQAWTEKNKIIIYADKDKPAAEINLSAFADSVFRAHPPGGSGKNYIAQANLMYSVQQNSNSFTMVIETLNRREDRDGYLLDITGFVLLK
ncbi:MAG: DUF4153 domain-containing protein [Ferruginibacter sp.]